MDDSSTDKERLVELYEARGDADTFARAKRLYEQALARAEAADPAALLGYGYLLECHGRYSLREAVAQYESAFLLERLGRLQEAAGAWRSIVDWCRSHDAPLTAEWPRQELERLRGRLSNGGARSWHGHVGEWCSKACGLDPRDRQRAGVAVHGLLRGDRAARADPPARGTRSAADVALRHRRDPRPVG